MPRLLRITCEIIASLLGFVVVFGVFLIWRLSSAPLHTSFLTPTIESGIENLVPGTHVSIAHTLLAWDNADRSIAMHADHVRVTDKNGNAIAEVPLLDIQLNAVGLLFGQFLPTEFTVDHPQFQLERQDDNSFTFGGVSAAGATTETVNGDDNVKDSLARLAGHLEHALFTHKLRISNAVFDIHDIGTKTDWSVSIPEIALERSGRDLTGQATIDVTQQDRVSTVDVHYIYDRTNGLHRLAARFSDLTPAFFAGGDPATLGFAQAAIVNVPLTGEISLAFDSQMNVASGALQVHGEGGTLNDAALWDEPRPIKSLDIRADYDHTAGVLNIPSAILDFGGPHLSLSGTGTPSGHNMDIAILAQLDNWPMDQYGQLWPKSAIPGAREWIAANLTKGRFDHAEANVKGVLDMDHPENATVTDVKGKVSASGARVHYADGMPPVEGVNADATFDLNQLTAQISGGGIDDIKVVPFALVISGFENDVQNIDIPLKVTGPIPSILKLIDHPPLNYAKAIGLSPGDITGQATAQVTFRFPLLKDLSLEDIGVTAKTNLSNVASSKLVKGISITQGNLDLDLNTEGFTVNGPATINAIPLQVALEQSFNEFPGKPMRQVTLTGNLSTEQLQAMGVDAFDGSHGPMAVTLHITQPTKTKTLFSGTLDMTGADIRIDQLNWAKMAKTPALASFAAEKDGNEDIAITSIEAHGPQVNIKGKATLSGDDGHLQSLTLSPMIIGRTNVSLHFSRLDDESDALHFDAEGDTLDVSGFKGGKEPENSQPQPKEFRVKVNKLYTSADGFIAKADGYAIRDGKGWSEISLHGLADGGHQINMELTARQDGGRDFALTCDDFGKALKGLGFTDTVSGGELVITGSSDPKDPRAIVGKVSIGSFNAGDLPVLAVLMNAASPFGFAGLFTGSMDFDRVRGKFRWEGDTVSFVGIHAAGASVGINVDGRIDMDSTEANLHGTMVPFSVVNSVIGSIPLIGYLFTGGKDQGFFAVNYSIKGPLSKPKIDVNPTSLLTPGFLRTLFFGGDDDDKGEK